MQKSSSPGSYPINSSLLFAHSELFQRSLSILSPAGGVTALPWGGTAQLTGTISRWCGCSLAASLCFPAVEEENSHVQDLSSLRKVLAALVEPQRKLTAGS